MLQSLPNRKSYCTWRTLCLPSWSPIVWPMSTSCRDLTIFGCACGTSSYADDLHRHQASCGSELLLLWSCSMVDFPVPSWSSVMRGLTGRGGGSNTATRGGPCMHPPPPPAIRPPPSVLRDIGLGAMVPTMPNFILACSVEEGILFFVFVVLSLEGVSCLRTLFCSTCTAYSHTMATLDLEKLLKRGNCVVFKKPPLRPPPPPPRLPPIPHPSILSPTPGGDIATPSPQ